MTPDVAALVAMTLDAVIVAVSQGRPRLLVVDEPGQLPALPSGPLDVERDATLELGLRRWVRSRTGLEVGYVEQLYTFGDRDRRPDAGPQRQVSVGYLALVEETEPPLDARWIDVYALLPWEDQRDAEPSPEEAAIRAALASWVAAGPDADVRRERAERVAVNFGPPWDGIRALERYELLYGAHLLPEWARDTGSPPPSVDTGIALRFDHRRIAATALSRLRGKLTYRPVVFELLPERFSLLELQHTVEALAGITLHKQNFRRLVERSGLVEGTGQRARSQAGRPAELFRFRPSVQRERPRPGVGVPYR